MAQVQIVLDQATKPAGVAGIAREDLDTGLDVTAAAVGGPFSDHLWSIVDKPIDFTAALQSTATLSAPTVATTLVTPIDLRGTYKLQLLVDSGSGLGATQEDIAEITFHASEPAATGLGPLAADAGELPRRRPGFKEKTEHNVTDPILTNNTRGWAQERDRWDLVMRRVYAGKSWAWGKIAVAGGGPATIVTTAGLRPQAFNIAVPTRTGLGVIDVVFDRNMLEADSYIVQPWLDNSRGFIEVTTQLTTGFTLETRTVAEALADLDFGFTVQQNPFFAVL